MFPPKIEATNMPIKRYSEEIVTAMCCIKELFQISKHLYFMYVLTEYGTCYSHSYFLTYVMTRDVSSLDISCVYKGDFVNKHR